MRRKEPKKQKQASPERLAKILDVPQNMFESYSQIVLSGNREAVLDGCQGVIEYEDDFLSEAGLTAEDRIMKLWWALGEYVVLDKEQIYRIAEMDQVKFLRFFSTYPIKMCVYKYTCEDALRILQAAVGLVSSNEGPYFDVNQDWSVDTFDALLALQSAVGLRTISWPEGMAFPE